MNLLSKLLDCSCASLGCCLRTLVACFVFLSLLDLLLTWRLVVASQGMVYESNPFAGNILADYGWCGLTWYKLAFTSLVVAVGLVVYQLRPRTGKLLFAGSNAALTFVVGYSLFLLVSKPWDDPLTQVTMAQEKARDEQQLDQLDKSQRYAEKLEALGQELGTRRRSLSSAVQELRSHLARNPYNPLGTMRQKFPDLSDDARLAVVLIRHALTALEDRPHEQSQALHRLRNDFQTLFHRPLPLIREGLKA